MLMVLGHNQLGNVLHAIVGPESEIYMDIHGAKILDITPILMGLRNGARTFLSLTRCKSEATSEEGLKSTEIVYLSSFGGKPVCDEPKHKNAGGSGTAVATKNGGSLYTDKAVNDGKSTVKTGVCSYCKANKELLNVAGFEICSDCAQIELGRRLNAK